MSIEDLILDRQKEYHRMANVCRRAGEFRAEKEHKIREDECGQIYAMLCNIGKKTTRMANRHRSSK